MTHMPELKQRTGHEVEGVHSPVKLFHLHNVMQGLAVRNHDADVKGINLTNCSATSVDAEQPTQGGNNE